eukprot:14801529-Ditylum_brightwellii.AAC.1
MPSQQKFDPIFKTILLRQEEVMEQIKQTMQLLTQTLQQMSHQSQPLPPPPPSQDNTEMKQV